MKGGRKVYFLMTAEQWLGVVLLTVLIVGILVLVKEFKPQNEVAVSWANDSVKTQFADYQNKQDSVRKETWKKRYSYDTIEIHMQMFDPNIADSSTLVHLGFKPWQAKNILKYRAKGGRYSKAEDIKRLYGMTDSMYQALRPYISIAREQLDSVDQDTMKMDSLAKRVSINRDTILNLRTADTTELKMIRGIGSYRARQIVRYREQLGGFVRVEQVMEVTGMDQMVEDSVLKWFVLDSVVVEKIRVNHVSAQRLSKHPYLRFEQAKAIYELRRKKIRLNSVNDLESIDCIDEKTLEKISPYLNFDKK